MLGPGVWASRDPVRGWGRAVSLHNSGWFLRTRWTCRPKREPSVTGTAHREALFSGKAATGEGSRTVSPLAKTQLVWSVDRETRGTAGPGQQIWQRRRPVLGLSWPTGGSPTMKGQSP